MRAMSLLLLLATASDVASDDEWAALLAIVEKYRAGDTHVAIEGLIALGPDGPKHSRAGIKASARGHVAVDVRAAAMLHTDVAEVLSRINPRLSLQHLDLARAWAGAAAKSHPEFLRNWELAAGLLLVEQGAVGGNIRPALEHFERLCRDRPGDASVLTVAAWLDERIALAPASWDPRRDPAAEGPQRMKRHYLRRAEERLIAVLAIDPLAAEAALRLARIRLLREDRAAAKRLLEPLVAQRDASDRIAFLARLFLARIMEEENDTAHAASMYRDAITRIPSAASARLGLARLLHSSNDYRGANEVLGPVLADMPADTPADPWHEYLNVHLGNGVALRRMLRAEVQR
jgi:thioredoxin-like negative regulator of GroEL